MIHALHAAYAAPRMKNEQDTNPTNSLQRRDVVDTCGVGELERRGGERSNTFEPAAYLARRAGTI